MFIYRVKFETCSGVGYVALVEAETAELAVRAARSYLTAQHRGERFEQHVNVRKSRAKNPKVVRRCEECGRWPVGKDQGSHTSDCSRQFAYPVGSRVEFTFGDNLPFVRGLVVGQWRAAPDTYHVYEISDGKRIHTRASWWVREPRPPHMAVG